MVPKRATGSAAAAGGMFGSILRALAILKEKLQPGAEIEHLWLALIIVALIGAVGLALMMAVGH